MSSWVTDNTTVPKFTAGSLYWRSDTMSKTPRNLSNIIAKLLTLVPGSEKEFRTRLISIQQNIGYKPPEMQQDHWVTISAVLNKFIPEPPSQLEAWSWKAQVVEEFTAKRLAQLVYEEENPPKEEDKDKE